MPSLPQHQEQNNNFFLVCKPLRLPDTSTYMCMYVRIHTQILPCSSTLRGRTQNLPPSSWNNRTEGLIHRVWISPWCCEIWLCVRMEHRGMEWKRLQSVIHTLWIGHETSSLLHTLSIQKPPSRLSAISSKWSYLLIN